MAEERGGILVVDVGGKNVKCWCSTAAPPERRRTPTGPGATPAATMAAVRELARDWRYDRVSVGVPGPVIANSLAVNPVNLGPGWVGFDFAAAFGVPTRVVNDAAMQALGSYAGGRMLFLGLGTGLGNTLVADGTVIAMELCHLPYKEGMTFEDHVGQRGLERLGAKRWQRAVRDVVARLRAATVADYVVIGGGNAKLVEELPDGCRRGDNNLAYQGGLRLWDEPVLGGPAPLSS